MELYIPEPFFTTHCSKNTARSTPVLPVGNLYCPEYIHIAPYTPVLPLYYQLPHTLLKAIRTR